MSKTTPKQQSGDKLTVAGLFAGIGGIEVGFHRAGHQTELLCEIDPGAQAVLKAHFGGVELTGDVCELRALPKVDLVAAGFPCQDLSQAGRTVGIEGTRSGLVGQVFRLIANPKTSPRWLLLENVPFMLQLEQGKAMRFLTNTLEEMGYAWAYRVVDTRAFGVPQRRQRVLLLASRTEDPREVLLVDDAKERVFEQADGFACGFYWTEGTRGLGWAVNAVPTVKGGSTIGIASPPAIWMPGGGGIVLPEIRDAERLQGFEADWTSPAVESGKVRQGMRWKLVGNAVSVPVAEWVGECLRRPRPYDASNDQPLGPNEKWPLAAWGKGGKQYRANVTIWPLEAPYQDLKEFLKYPTKPLSERATAGFYSRTQTSSLKFPPGFLSAVTQHLENVRLERSLA
jgi:DNA (cytosine-5)-methyltransferase 1